MLYVNATTIAVNKSRKPGEGAGMIKVPKEKRSHRVRLGMSMSCIISTNAVTPEEGTTFDIGKGGMCVFSNKCLDPGHIVEIQCKTIWDTPKTGAVKWCHKIKHNLYRIGVEFAS